MKIEKILGKKQKEDLFLYLIKIKGKSYLHVKWWNENEIKKKFSNQVKKKNFLFYFFF